MTSKNAHTQTPITAAITDVLIQDPEISPPFTTTITDTEVVKLLVTSKGPKAQSGPTTIAPTPMAQQQATWKRKPKAQRPKNSMDTDKPHLGPKRKSSGLPLEVSPNTDKKQRMEDETMSLSKLFAQQLGSAVAIAQHRWDQ